MDRRTLIKGMVGAATLPLAATRTPATAAPPVGLRPKVRPGGPGWPSAAEWDRLRASVGGRLVDVTSPIAACRADPNGPACAETLKNLRNPFYIQDQAGGTQTVGWLDAWTSQPSVYAVAAERLADVVAAVDFAREKNLRLVVKSGGHSYLGQSNAPDSLLLWLKPMHGMIWHDAFVPRGRAGLDAPTPAVSVEPGANFLQLYDFVTTRHGRYVQGGGCTTVGVGGHLPTGGFGSFSKNWGLAAAGLLEAEIVTADGRVRIVNQANDPDLFYAIRGGGASYGVTTRLTLRTHPLPAHFGYIGQTIKAKDAAAFERLIAAFLPFAETTLVDRHWGEQVAFDPDNGVEIAVVFQGLDEAAARAQWQPFWAWLAAHRHELASVSDPKVITAPARHFWDRPFLARHVPGMFVADTRSGARPGAFWWAGNSTEVGVFLDEYESAWLPAALLTPARRGALAAALFEASRHAKVSLHFNKGLAGAPETVRAAARALPIHPSAADAFALAIIASGQQHTHPGLAGHEPDLAKGRRDADRVRAATAALRRVAPETGAYCSEASYFAEDWRERSWGPNYARLLAVKQKYDPRGLFFGHHWVGSEFWSRDGFTPKT